MSRRADQHRGFLLAALAVVVAAWCSDKPRAEPTDPVPQQAEDEFEGRLRDNRQLDALCSIERIFGVFGVLGGES